MRKVAMILILTLAACGEAEQAQDNNIQAAAEPVGSEAEVAADAALADQAAQAEAEDAAIGGNVTPEDVSAAGNAALNAQ